MKKIIWLFIISYSFIYAESEKVNINDFRKINWGMTKDEVEKIENEASEYSYSITKNKFQCLEFDIKIYKESGKLRYYCAENGRVYGSEYLFEWTKLTKLMLKEMGLEYDLKEKSGEFLKKINNSLTKKYGNFKHQEENINNIIINHYAYKKENTAVVVRHACDNQGQEGCAVLINYYDLMNIEKLEIAEKKMIEAEQREKDKKEKLDEDQL